MKRVTRDIDPRDAQDLLERPPRACIAFASDIGPLSQSVAVVWNNNCYVVGIPEDESRRPGPGDEVVLLVDEGVQFFDLRAIYVRGQVKAAEAPAGASAGYTWLELVPTKTVAWDYGRLREVDDES